MGHDGLGMGFLIPWKPFFGGEGTGVRPEDGLVVFESRAGKQRATIGCRRGVREATWPWGVPRNDLRRCVVPSELVPLAGVAVPGDARGEVEDSPLLTRAGAGEDF